MNVFKEVGALKRKVFIALLAAVVLVAGGVIATGLLTRDISGTVTYVELEGGYWAIKDDRGNTYIPLNLEQKWQQEGLRVRFRVVEKPDLAGIHMDGTYVEIVEVLD